MHFAANHSVMRLDKAPAATPRKSRNTGIRQSDIARAIRGAMQAGMDIGEVIATRDGVRIVSKSFSPQTRSDNSWDDLLDG